MKCIKIKSCNDGMLWYARSIGKVVPFLGEDVDAKGPIFWSRDNGGYKNIVFQSDAEIVYVDSERDN